jgi:hypothetical protein
LLVRDFSYAERLGYRVPDLGPSDFGFDLLEENSSGREGRTIFASRGVRAWKCALNRLP